MLFGHIKELLWGVPMKLETLKLGLLIVDMLLLSLNIALELKKKNRKDE